MEAFKLSAQLSGHEQDVRAVRFPKPDAVLTASRDNTVRLWRKTSDAPPVFDDTIVTHGSESINSLAFLPPTAEYEHGLVLSGARDAIIEVRLPTADPSQDSLRLLVGHTNNVCTLDIAPNSKYLVSGGWDGQARVWRVGKWETEVMLLGHGTGGANDHKGVWGVLAFDEDTVVTGCADHMIRGYDLRNAKDGQLQPSITLKTPDIVRALCRLSPAHPSGAHIASAGNDGVIRLWKLNGQQVAELHGHESFIYSLDCLPTGEIVSSGEDRTVRVWKDRECIQTITHPAISVWSVAVCPETGDIVSGASDRIARVFTRSPDRVAALDMLREFDESVKASAIPQQQMGDINKERLPGPDFLKSKSGTKEGQIQMIKEDNGSVSAHQWSTGQQQWVMVGTVVDAPSSSGRKVEYQGQSYDFVFDVDIEDGKPALKLPYNLSDNPYERATKFLGDNELPMTYLDSVANFIVQNTQGATLGQGANAPDPYGTENRYVPGQPAPPATLNVSAMPPKEYVTLLQAKLPPIHNKITSLNAELVKSGEKQYALNPQEEEILSALVELLSSVMDKLPLTVSPTASGTAAAQLMRVPKPAIDLVVKVVSNWPYANKLPTLDLLRCMCASESVASFSDPRDRNILDIVLASATASGSAEGKLVENTIMMALRAIANLFVTPAGRAVAAARADEVVALMECVVGVSDEPQGDVRGPVGKTNRNVLVALTSAAINYSVLAYTEQAVGAGAGAANSVGEAALTLMANVVGRVLQDQTDSEVLFRALVALANIVGIPGEGNYPDVAKSLGAEGWVKTAQGKASEDRVKNLAGSILRSLT